MASLIITPLSSYSEYKDRYFAGNLSFFTTEQQLYALFSRVGPLKRIIMGLDRNKLTPCGFCFIQYELRSDAMAAIETLGGTRLDDRHIRVDLDSGFVDGRQYGRGKSGGQVRDELRDDYDEGRGGYGYMMRGMAYEGDFIPQEQQQFQKPHHASNKSNKRKNYDTAQSSKRVRE